MRPDLHVVMGHRLYLIDVSIVHPAALSYISIANQPLGLRKKEEKILDNIARWPTNRARSVTDTAFRSNETARNPDSLTAWMSATQKA